MDLADINKVASRKRVNTDAETLREKMTRESSKIIKLRVAQDTAYWELKEQLSGVRAEHERLQQNMVDVQMQHEALSARYQDELRLRSDTRARLEGARALAATLDDQAARLRTTLGRALADRAATAAAYEAAARRVQCAATAAGQRHAALADQLRLSAQLTACAESARRSAEEALGAARGELHDAAEHAQCHQAAADELRARAATLHRDLQERERTIADLRQEAERRAFEAAAEAEGTERDRAALQREVQRCGAALEAVQDALAAAEGRADRQAEEIAQRAEAVKNVEKIVVDLERKLESVGEANVALKEQIRRREHEARTQEARAEAVRVEAETARDALREERAAAGEARAAADRALAEHADTVARLMHDLTAATEARVHSDENVRALAAALQNKEEELAGQTKIVLEIRSEKERLQDIIAGMQGTIDNIQEELRREGGAGAAAAAASAARREPPELDNALPAPPVRRERLELDINALPAPPAHRERPELDDNVLPAPPVRRKRPELDINALPAPPAHRERPELDDNVLPAPPVRRERPELDINALPAPPAHRERPELDDNVLPAPPVRREGPELDINALPAPSARRERPELDDNVLPAPPARREPPEFDDNALPSPPAPRAQPRLKHPKDLLYHFLSDSSTDADALDPNEVNARFEALSRGTALPAISLQALKRRQRPAALATLQAARDPDADAVSLSQIKSELATRGRSFFRNKRLDAKPRKLK